jgi:hypothetical protein
VQGETFKFLVDKLEPEGNGICVVDNDVEVDIEALSTRNRREKRSGRSCQKRRLEPDRVHQEGESSTFGKVCRLR